MNRLIILLLLSATIISCSKSGNFSIKGTITNSQSKIIYLDELVINGTTPFDSSTIDSKGNFQFTGSVSYPTFFLLRMGNQKFITLLIDSLEKVTISADFINFSKEYNIEGSIGSEKVRDLNNQLAKTNNQLDSIQSLLVMSTDNRDYPALRDKWINELKKTYQDQEEYSKKFIAENPFSMASVLAIYQKFNNGDYIVQDLQSLKVAASALNSMYPNSVHAQTLYKDTEKLVQDIRQQELTEFIKQYGKNSPDITLPDANGKNITLSSLEGKVVLVQFWSAFDKTSRVMNGVLKENYQKFNTKGFEIYQVSIDTQKEAWLAAIKEDQLNWINVGDMQGSTQAIQNFNIRNIPANYLINRDGTIVARNIKGPEIHQKLSEILN